MKIRRILLTSTLCLALIAAGAGFLILADHAPALSGDSGISAVAAVMLILLALPAIVAFVCGLIAAAVYFHRKFSKN